MVKEVIVMMVGSGLTLRGVVKQSGKVRKMLFGDDAVLIAESGRKS